MQAQLSCRRCDTIQPDLHAEAYSSRVHGVGKGLRQAHMTIVLAPVILGPPSPDLDRRGINAIVGGIACFQGGIIDEQLEGGARLPLQPD